MTSHRLHDVKIKNKLGTSFFSILFYLTVFRMCEFIVVNKLCFVCLLAIIGLLLLGYTNLLPPPPRTPTQAGQVQVDRQELSQLGLLPSQSHPGKTTIRISCRVLGLAEKVVNEWSTLLFRWI